MSATESYATISCPFQVKDLSKFLAWALPLGLQIQYPLAAPHDRVIISPGDEDEWHHISVPDAVDFTDDDDSFWKWFAPELAQHIPEGKCAILYESWYNARKSVTSAGGGVYLISCEGTYVYGDLNTLVEHLWEKTFGVQRESLYSCGIHGVPIINLTKKEA